MSVISIEGLNVEAHSLGYGVNGSLGLRGDRRQVQVPRTDSVVPTSLPAQLPLPTELMSAPPEQASLSSAQAEIQ